MHAVIYVLHLLKTCFSINVILFNILCFYLLFNMVRRRRFPRQLVRRPRVRRHRRRRGRRIASVGGGIPMQSLHPFRVAAALP